MPGSNAQGSMPERAGSVSRQISERNERKPLGLPSVKGELANSAVPTGCSASEDMSVTINFPQCWDGRNLDSPDHKSHMAFTSSNNNRGCPASHPVALPAISINARFDVTPSSDLTKWRLSSDMYGTDKPAGLSLQPQLLEPPAMDAVLDLVQTSEEADAKEAY